MESVPIPVRIAIDAMGGDRGPAEVVEAVKLTLRSEAFQRDSHLVLAGPEAVLTPLIRQAALDGDGRVSIFPANEVIGMEDKPIESYKRKKDASMIRAIELVKRGDCQAAISCGNTGALVACGTLILRPLPGISKPAIATVIPSKDHFFILVDAGANPLAKPEDMVANAVLGSCYARIVLGVANPRIGLLSIGTEEGKGNELIVETHQLLKRLNGQLNYQGLTEGLQLFNNHVDVVVCDGFVGNILLKTCESLYLTMKDMVKAELVRTTVRKIGAWLCQGAFRDLKARLNPERYGGAPLLGLGGNLLKAHGSSNRHALCGAIRVASEFISQDLNHHTIEAMAEVRSTLKTPGPDRPNPNL